MTGEMIVAYGSISKNPGTLPISFGPGTDLTPEMVEVLDNNKSGYPESAVVLLGHDGETSVIFFSPKGGVMVTQGSPENMANMLRNTAGVCDVLDKIHTGETDVSTIVKSVQLTTALAVVLGEQGMEKLAEAIRDDEGKK